MKRIYALLFLVTSLCLVPAYSYSHGDHDHDEHHALASGEEGRSKQEIFDELLGYYQAILLTQKKILESEKFYPNSSGESVGSKRLLVTSGEKADSGFVNKDMMSLLFAQVARAYRLGMELDCESACQNRESQHDLDKIEKTKFEQLQTMFNKKAKSFGRKAKRFFVEFFPEMYQYSMHHGLSFGLWLAITEPLEHVILAPLLGGLPICKLLYGVYFAIANPIRSFFGIVLNRYDGRMDVVGRLKGALASWVYERRFKARMKAVLVHSSDPALAMTQKAYLKTLEKESTQLEHELAKTSFWAEAFSYFKVNTEATGNALTLSMNKQEALFVDLATVYGDQSEEVRFDRALRLVEGLKQVSSVMARLLDSTYYENTQLKEPVTWFEFFKLKGLIGETDRLIDLFSFNLQTVAITRFGHSKESDAMRLASMALLEDSVREIFHVFEEAAVVALIPDAAERKLQVGGLVQRVKLLSKNQQRIASGRACRQALTK